jgi:iron complex transport system substrate-binding protein
MKARALGGWLLFVLATVVAAAAERPQRVVSLNLASDHWLLELAEPSQIAALTFLAHDPIYCPRWETARTHRAIRGSAEEVLRLRPDLVIAGRWGATQTVAMLRRLGVRVEVMDSPEDFAGVAAQARQVGAWLGRSAAAERFVAQLEQRLARVRGARPAQPVDVLEYSQNGWVHGAGSPFTRLVEEAGGRNLAVERGVDWIARVSLEELVRWNPEALVVPVAVSGSPSLGDELLRHPVFARVADRATEIRLPEGTADFGGPYTIEGLEVLAAGMRAAVERRTR